MLTSWLQWRCCRMAKCQHSLRITFYRRSCHQIGTVILVLVKCKLDLRSWACYQLFGNSPWSVICWDQASSKHKATVPRLLQMLKTKFSEEGSNADDHVERGILSYATFWSLSQVCLKNQFLDLGWSIAFVLPVTTPITTSVEDSTTLAGVPKLRADFPPTAHTCLSLPRPSHEFQLPSQ